MVAFMAFILPFDWLATRSACRADERPDDTVRVEPDDTVRVEPDVAGARH